MSSRPKRARVSANDSPASTKKPKTAADAHAVEHREPLAPPKRKMNEEEDPYWDLSAKRRVTVQEYKGTTLVAFREYYQKDGKDLPGKQGISLNIEQFKALLLTMPEIVKVLTEKGILTPEDTGEEQPGEGGLDAPLKRVEEKKGDED